MSENETEEASDSDYSAFDARPSAPNQRLERKRRRTRYVRMALAFTLIPLFVLGVWLLLDLPLEYALLLSILVLHAVMGMAEMILDDLPDAQESQSEEPQWMDRYARWFGFRDW